MEKYFAIALLGLMIITAVIITVMIEINKKK